VPRWPALIVLTLSPLLIAAGLIGALLSISTFRKGFGAFTTLRPEAVLAALGVLALHAGYFAGPFLYSSGRRGLHAWLTLPVGAVATVLIVWAAVTISAGPRNFASKLNDALAVAALVAGLLVYWLPAAVVLLALGEPR